MVVIMGLKEIKERSVNERRQYDHIGWTAVCRKCGLSHVYLSEELRRDWRDCRIDLRDKEIECNSPRCKGKLVSIHRMPEERALHLCDIRRRK